MNAALLFCVLLPCFYFSYLKVVLKVINIRIKTGYRRITYFINFRPVLNDFKTLKRGSGRRFREDVGVFKGLKV